MGLLDGIRRRGIRRLGVGFGHGRRDTGRVPAPFVVGIARSGTTLLRLMLDAHPQLTIPPETHFLPRLFTHFDRWVEQGIEGAELRERAMELIVSHPRWGDIDLDPQEVERRMAHHDPLTAGDAARSFYEAYAAQEGKPRWGDKSPPYTWKAKRIQRALPEAHFIHLIRDGRDCVASLKRMSWWGQSSIDAMVMWTHSVDCGRRAARRLPADAFYAVRYEQLVTDPRGELMAVCDFLGEEFEETMLESHLVAAPDLPERQRTEWHANTGKEVNAAAICGYTEGLDPWELRLFEFVAGARLRRLGYDVPSRPALPRLTALARYEQKLLWLRLKTRVLIVQDRWIARRSGPMADQGPA